jgi:hypothetical protein
MSTIELQDFKELVSFLDNLIDKALDLKQSLL